MSHLISVKFEVCPKFRACNSTVGFKKTRHNSFPNVNLVLSICQLIVYLTIPIKSILKMSLNFDHNSNLSLVRRFYTIKKPRKLCQFFVDVSRPFFESIV
jgi:hypothetical protein